jgi:hypothetical protein
MCQIKATEARSSLGKAMPFLKGCSDSAYARDLARERLRASPRGWKAQLFHESEIVLFSECVVIKE